MSYQEKKTVTSIVTEALVLAAYLIRALGKAAPADLKGWAVEILIFIGIGVVAAVVIQIVFHILLSVSIAVKEAPRGNTEIEREIKADMVEDERDKLIELKSSRVGFTVSGGGFVMGLAALVLGFTPVVMINVLFVVFCAGSIAGEFAKLFFYRKGV